MCTVAFIPKGNQYYFASLRDESPGRTPAMPPQLHTAGKESYVSPTDGKAGGTWIGISSWGNIIILLNGGFKDHERQPQYTKSRGLIVAELLSVKYPVQKWSDMTMDTIEPFTLVVFTENNLYELVWDGNIKHCKSLTTGQPYIWSSATLYEPAAKLNRQKMFNDWTVMNAPISALSMLDFFRSSPDKENGFIINRNNKMQTLSYSFITLDKNKNAVLQYFDLLHSSRHSHVVDFRFNATELVQATIK